MSNFIDNIKEAVSDHRDRDRVPTNEPTGRHNTAGSTNSHGKDPETGPGASHDFNNQGPPDTYNSEMTGTNTTNAGPHDSKVANKLEPRVDSDLDYRAGKPGMASQGVGGTPAQGTNTGNMPPTGQPRTSGIDNYTADEDKYNKSTQEHKAHTQPGMPGLGNQATSEDDFRSSTQEHKTHSSTSHTAPGDVNPRAQPGPQTQAAQPGFGGGAPAGGSSYNQPSVTEPADMPSANTRSKAGTQVQGKGYQRNDVGNQRSAY